MNKTILPVPVNKFPVTDLARASSADPIEPTKISSKAKATELVNKIKTAELKGKKVPPCPCQKIVALYHEICPMLPKVRIWTTRRAMYLRIRWRESEKHQSLNFWRSYFEHVTKSKFLTGRTSSGDRPPFLADLEWLILPSNFTKVVEDRYHR